MNNFLQRAKGFRTVIVNITAAIAVIGTALAGIDLNGDVAAFVVTLVAAANVILRYFTTTPIFKGEEDAQ